MRRRLRGEDRGWREGDEKVREGGRRSEQNSAERKLRGMGKKGGNIHLSN